MKAEFDPKSEIQNAMVAVGSDPEDIRSWFLKQHKTPIAFKQIRYMLDTLTKEGNAADRYLKIVEKHLNHAIVKGRMKCNNCTKPIQNGPGYVQHIVRGSEELSFLIYCGTICAYLHMAHQIESVQKARFGIVEEQE